MIIYLMVKQHSITGLKYFCKTTSKNKLGPFKYLGSGEYWLGHLTFHGKEHIRTIEVWGFDTLSEAKAFAINFSKDNNIVGARHTDGPRKGKKVWANKIIENALDGAPSGVNFSKEHRRKIGECRNGKVSSYDSNGNYFLVEKDEFYSRDDLIGINKGKTWESPKRRGIATPNFKGHNHSKESKTKTSITLRGKPKVTCPHCGKIGADHAMKRDHFDNCLKSPGGGRPRPKIECPHCGKVTDHGNAKQWHFNNCKSLMK